MKKIKLIAITTIAACLLSGCNTAKQMVPNSWNLTWYQPTHGSESAQEGQMIGFGISGNLPWGNSK